MIDLTKDQGRWTVTLNRPDKANALTVDMLERLDAIFAAAQAEHDLRVLVVTGAGDRVFCAGADLGQAKDAGITTNPIWESVSNRLAALPCLTIAALNGTLAGGGFGVGLACDLRLAVPGAKFFYPVLKNGFLPQPSDVKRLNALIGPARTRLILLAGQKLDTAEALSIGLIDRIVDAADMPQMINQLSAAALTAREPVLAAIKKLGQSHLSDDLRQDCYRAVYQDDSDALLRIRR
jgi:enoyl-CoA hydratase/carnithine racemase